MATYIPGVQSYMPEMKTFTPDYKFLSSVLDTKTNRYNTNYKQLNDLYSKVVYADLSRGDTKDQRNQYIETLAPKLEKISGMDLSMQQNVDAARGLFKPFYEDDLIVRDMVVTKSYQKDIKYANDLKNSTDRDRRGMYWDTGIKAMNYQMEDFVNADAKDALNMAVPRYVEDADLYNTAQKLLEESKFSEGVIEEMPDANKNFIIRRKNGDLMAGDAHKFLKNALRNDPKVKDAYYTQSFVDSRNTAAAGIQAGQFSSIDEGQRFWALNTIQEEEAKLRKTQDKNNIQKTKLQNSNTSWKQFNNSVGIIPGSKAEADMKRQQTLLDVFGVKGAEVNNLLQTAAMPASGSTTQELLNRAYNIKMAVGINNDLVNAAVDFSKMGQELIYKGETAEFARERDLEYFKEEERIKQENRETLERLKAGLEGGGLGDPFSGTSEVKVSYDDAKTITVENANIADINKRVASQYNDVTLNEMADFVIMAAKATQPGVTNNMYTLTVGDKEVTLAPGDPTSKGNNTLYELLHKRDLDGNFVNSAEITRLYDQYNNSINQKPSDDNPNPLTTTYPSLTYDSEAYKNLKNYSASVNQRRELLKESRRKQNEHYIKMYDLAVAGGNTLSSKYNDNVLPIIKNGLDFDIFNRDENRIKTLEEFTAEYIAVAKPIKIPNRPRAGTQNRYMNVQEMFDAGLLPNFTQEQIDEEDNGYIPNKIRGDHFWDMDKMYLDKKVSGGYSVGLGGYPKQSSTTYVPNMSLLKKDAEKIYGGMYDLLNKTQNDSYNIAADEGAGKGTTSGTFSSYSMRNALRGNPALGSATEVTQNPTYSVDIEPTTIRTDGNAIMLVRDVITQYNNTPRAETGVVLGPVNDDSNLNDTSSEDAALALRIFEAYLQDVKAYGKNPTLSKDVRPQATLSYTPVYGLPEGEKDYAAYTVENISEAWLKKRFPKTFNTQSYNANQESFTKYTSISYAFNKDRDLSVRREGEYNFSNVLSQIENTDNQQYEENIENGGSLRITRNINGSFDLSVQMQNYNPQTGNMEIDPNITKINFSKFLRDHNLDDTDLDFGANYYKDFLLNKSEANTKAAKADAKINKSK